jgi:signal transduction histidine kinase
LLRTEGLVSENAPKYLDVLELKSLRLKSLTEDLFEAAKASSGNIAVNPERIDVDSLLRQGLGEMSDRIEEANLDVRLESPSHELYVKADGKLLWRAIENLLTNALKYSLSGSRVYISANSLAGEVQVTIKNISATELNIPADELFERFKRGDESRTTDGSGLGLSIAKSLVELQKGKLDIDIDGDLFKATITLPTV